MKKSMIKILSLALLGLAVNAQAKDPSYTVVYGEKQINGDNISFVSKWLSSDPLLGNWTNVGSPTGCSAWTPDVSTKNIGVTFDQTATGCSQDQTRTVQEREKNNVSGEYRNLGSVKNENQTLKNQTLTRSANGTKVIEECSKDVNTRWVNGTPSFGVMYVMWEGVKVFPDSGNIYLTEYTYNGYKYTKGAQTANAGYYTFHSVCRVPI
jgi:hypothetical protein